MHAESLEIMQRTSSISHLASPSSQIRKKQRTVRTLQRPFKETSSVARTNNTESNGAPEFSFGEGFHRSRISDPFATARVPEQFESSRMLDQIAPSRASNQIESSRVPEQFETSRAPEQFESSRIPEQFESSRTSERNYQCASIPVFQVLAVHVTSSGYKSKILGACHYDSSNKHAELLGRMTISDETLEYTLSLLVEQVLYRGSMTLSSNHDGEQPLTVLLSSKCDEGFADIVQKLANSRSWINIQMIPGSCYDLQSSITSLREVGKSTGYNDMVVEEMVGGLNHSEMNLLHAESGLTMVDKSNEASLLCFGAILHFTNRSSNRKWCKSITTAAVFCIDQYMLVDWPSLKSLDVIRNEEHPSMIRGRGRAKEGFSLLSLLDIVHSGQGRKLMRRWVLQPLCDEVEIRKRQDVVEVFTSHKLQDILVLMEKQLVLEKDIAESVRRITNCCAKISDWVALFTSLVAGMQLVELVRQVCDRFREPHPGDAGVRFAPTYLEEVSQSQFHGTRRAIAAMESFVDWGETAKTDGSNWVFQPGVNKEYATCCSVLERIDEILESFRGDLHSCFGITLGNEMQLKLVPSMGFVIATSTDCDIPLSATLKLREFHQTKSERLFKSELTERLDSEFGDIHYRKCWLEAEMLRKMEFQVLQEQQNLLSIAHICAQLDVLIAFAKVAKNNDYTRPRVHRSNNTLLLRGARHPLQELSVNESGQQFVPNDCCVGVSASADIKPIGPNYSGKSVYLKTVGLIVYMAHIGCFVPADIAEIGIVDRIFTRVESHETSSALVESTFTIDAQQLAMLLRNATSQSLILVDEFGKGTNTLDGVCLLSASLEYLFHRSKPRTLVTTHFSEIFDFQVLSNDVMECGIHVCEMRVAFEEESDQNPAANRMTTDAAILRAPVPLFQLCHGRAAYSYGIACAKRCGVADGILQRAASIFSGLETMHRKGGSTQQQPLLNILMNGGENEPSEPNSASERDNDKLSDIEAMFLRSGIQWSTCSDVELGRLLAQISKL